MEWDGMEKREGGVLFSVLLLSSDDIKKVPGTGSIFFNPLVYNVLCWLDPWAGNLF